MMSAVNLLVYQRLFHLKLYYELLQTIDTCIHIYILLQYTIFQLKMATFTFECSIRIYMGQFSNIQKKIINIFLIIIIYN